MPQNLLRMNDMLRGALPTIIALAAPGDSMVWQTITNNAAHESSKWILEPLQESARDLYEAGEHMDHKEFEIFLTACFEELERRFDQVLDRATKEWLNRDGHHYLEIV